MKTIIILLLFTDNPKEEFVIYSLQDVFYIYLPLPYSGSEEITFSKT